MNRLVEYLKAYGHYGAKKAVKRDVLASALVVSIREIRSLAEDARNAGVFVAYSTSAKDGGIFIAETGDEKVAIIGQIRSACLSRLKQYGALKQALRDTHQKSLFPETVDQVFSRGGQR